MADLERRVCCMCGDVGFFDKLFHCNKCLNRFQHSYCSSYYKEQGDPIKICDWCQYEAKNRSGAKNSVNVGSSKRSYRSEYSSSSAHKIKHQEINKNQITTTNSSNSQATVEKGKTSVPSPRLATRRYKLLKDVMC